VDSNLGLFYLVVFGALSYTVEPNLIKKRLNKSFIMAKKITLRYQKNRRQRNNL